MRPPDLDEGAGPLPLALAGLGDLVTNLFPHDRAVCGGKPINRLHEPVRLSRGGRWRFGRSAGFEEAGNNGVDEAHAAAVARHDGGILRSSYGCARDGRRRLQAEMPAEHVPPERQEGRLKRVRERTPTSEFLQPGRGGQLVFGSYQRKVAIAMVGRWPWRAHTSARRAGSGSAPGAMPISSACIPRVTNRLS